MDYVRIKATTPDGVGKRYVCCDRDGRLYSVPVESKWLTATIAKGGTTTNAIDLGESYKQLLVLMPAVDSAYVTVHIAKEVNGTYFPLWQIAFDDSGDVFMDKPVVTATFTTATHALIFNIGGIRFFKIVASASQTTAERIFYVKGIN